MARGEDEEYAAVLASAELTTDLLVKKPHNDIKKKKNLEAKNTNGNSVADRISVAVNWLLLVVGQPSSGKSSLLKQLSSEQRDSGNIVLWWDLSKNGHKQVKSIQELLDLPLPGHLSGLTRPPRDLAEKIRRSEGKGIIIVIDNLKESSGFLSQLLSKAILPNCAIVAAAQYKDVEKVITKVPKYELFEMKGVSEASVYDVILMKGKKMNLKSTDRIADYIRAYPELLQMCRYPALMELVLEVFKTNKYQCPKTVTQLIKDIVDIKIERATKDGSLASIVVEEYIEFVCYFAYVSMEREHFSEYEFSCVCTNIGISGPRMQFGLGLVQILIEKDRVSCKFIHRTIQMYLAALYIRNRPIFEQAYLTLELSNKILSNDQHAEHYLTLLAYFCGTAHTHWLHTSSLNIGKITLYPLLETLAEKLSFGESRDSKNLLIFFRCLYEAQDPNIVRKFLSRRQKLLKIPIRDEKGRMLSEPKLLIVSYCVAHSGVNSWVIEASPENIFMVDYFKMLITDQLSSDAKSTFQVRIVQGSLNQLSPSDPNDASPSKLKSNVYSRIARELFHRLLQLHSPIKLKSDGSNAAYISLLACECLQKEMEAQKVLRLQSICSCHWLPMKSKTKKVEGQKDENQQTLIHMRHKHDNEYVEFVIMMRPFPHRIVFITPGTFNEIVIELCTDNSPDFLPTGIGHNHELPLSMFTLYTETQFSATAKLVVPDLPLPKQTHSRALTVAPDVPEPPRAHNQQRKTPSDNFGFDKAAIPVEDSSTYPLLQSTERQEGRAVVAQPGHQDQVGAYGSTITFSGVRFEPEVQVHRPLAARPGVVVHTNIPHVFALDQQYPLPDETHLIRKGGNGEIFSGFFGGEELAVKKTSFRNREFLIHSKLRHQNVIQLLCLMMGEKHPRQRRKVICYHFLPRAHGDLARLAVDNEKNTLKQLRFDHGSNAKKFGSIQGNLRYLLTQVLRGLAYLHSLDIVHRDLKASNILLTFHCLCRNPLLCSCSRKCDVQLADFDSAVQLTMEKQLPPTKTTNQNQKLFAVVPVGTMGYRPPESSQLTISNDVGIVSPQVTTKSDIWSFGVLMMKMLNGNYGPSSQREVSLWLFLCLVT